MRSSDDENWPVAGGAASISPPAVSLVSSAEPDPFVNIPNDRYSTGSKTYAFGWDENRSERLQVALYHDTQERDEKCRDIACPGSGTLGISR